jgi:hypothetical protein
MEPWRLCRPVVADSHHFDEEQDPDLDPHYIKGTVSRDFLLLVFS